MSDADGHDEDVSAEGDASMPADASSEPSPIDTEIRRAIEAIVMVAESPADPRLLAQLIEVSPERIDAVCEALERDYADQGRGFEMVRVAGGWRYQSRGELAPYVERFVLSGQTSRLSAAALETLAIVAYKQPMSRAQVAAIRGVNVDGVMRTLQQRGYIAELARDPGPGQAVLFGTTSQFLERLGLNSLDDLPPLGEFVPSAEIVEALETGLLAKNDTDSIVDSDSESDAHGNETNDVDEPGDDDGQGDERHDHAASHDGAGSWGGAGPAPLDDEVIDLRAADSPTAPVPARDDTSDDVAGPPSEEPLDAIVLLADDPVERAGDGGDVGH